MGVYDVILPFLLVFTIMYAVFEKTKVLGTEKNSDGKVTTKRNLNSMVSFCIAFFVTICFLMLIGSFYKEQEQSIFLEGGWKIGFMIAMLGGVILIFLHAIKTSDGTPWLYFGYDFMVQYWNQEWLASIIFIVFVAGFMFWVTKAPKVEGKDEKKDKK